MYADTEVLGPRIDALLETLWTAHGTDLLLTVGLAPRLRVDGELVPADAYPACTEDDLAAFLAEMLTPEQFDQCEKQSEYDFAFSWLDQARVRGSAYFQRGKRAIALRMIPREVPTMRQLALPAAVGQFATQHQGLVIVTGPTGSGKSTTLAAIINQINLDRSCHIITIEDPIEYLHEHKRSVIEQREVGSDTASFPDALRAVLREDPDVILVGEMRDLESIRSAITLAETGHLVFATMHTNDTAQSLSRIIDVFPAEQQEQIRVQLAAALTGIVYQRLIPCQRGGLVAAHEVLLANQAVRNLIKEGKTHQLRNQLVTGRREGMVTFEQSLLALVQNGVVSMEDALARSLFPTELGTPTPQPKAVPSL